MSGWMHPEEFEPQRHPCRMLAQKADGTAVVVEYVWPRSSRSPGWWGTVPGRWRVEPVVLAYLPAPFTSPGGGTP